MSLLMFLTSYQLDEQRELMAVKPCQRDGAAAGFDCARAFVGSER